MSLPAGGVSSQPMPSAFLYPDDLWDRSGQRSYEMGGVAISDASQGLLVQPWEFYITGDKTQIKLRVLDDPSDGVLLVSGTGITQVSGSFDRNMRPHLAWVDSDIPKFRWYDTVIEGYTTTNYPANQPMLVTHDDKRVGADGRSDVILTYLRTGTLYYRQQRDRFSVEYTLQGGVPHSLRRVGLNSGLRLQWEFY